MRVKNKLFTKLFVTTAAVMLISILVTTTILSIVTTAHFTAQRKKVMLGGCATVTDYCAGNTAQIASRFPEIASLIASSSDADVFVTDPFGRVLHCSCAEWQSDGACSHSVASVDKGLLATNKDEPHFEFGNLGGAFSGLHYSALAPIKSADGTLSGYVISVSSATSLNTGLYRDLRWLYILSSVLAMLVMLVVQYFSTYRITRPLRQMSQAAVALASGDFSRRIPVTSNDELGELATAFNQMTNSLSRLEGVRRSFIANVSHELKTPMTTISGFIDGIIDGTIPPEKQPYYLNIISQETKRLSRVVQSMLSLAQLESGKATLNLHRFDMSSLVCAVVVAREQSINEKNIEIRGLDDLQTTFVRADRDLIYQVVYNLVDNAVKFTNDGGYIEFCVHTVKGGVQVKVKNSGQGISPEALPLVFERFYKEDRSRSQRKNSTGLGLYLAKTIIKIHGGSISVNSLEQKYVEFEFTLPSSIS